jgi:hypothetical protein
MKRFNFILLTCSALFAVTSCATRVPFTKEIIEKYELSEVKLKQVQFYTSDYIVLEANNSTGDQYVVDGKIIDSQNNKKYNIIIQPQTKCILEKMEKNGDVYIRFEQGKNKFLHFAVRTNDNSGRYYLVSKAANNTRRQVDYEDKEYFINSSSANAFLMVSIQKLNKTYGENKFVKGMKVK